MESLQNNFNKAKLDNTSSDEVVEVKNKDTILLQKICRLLHLENNDESIQDLFARFKKARYTGADLMYRILLCYYQEHLNIGEKLASNLVQFMEEQDAEPLVSAIIKKFTLIYATTSERYSKENRDFPSEYYYSEALTLLEDNFIPFMKKNEGNSPILAFVETAEFINLLKEFNMVMLKEIIKTLSPPEKVPPISSQKEYLVNQYYDVKNDFTAFINYCFKEIYVSSARSEKYYSPYFPVCQSSGTGKTRLILESAKPSLPLLYLCFRKTGATGEPAGCETLYRYIVTEKKLCNEWLWYIFLMVALRVMFAKEIVGSGGSSASAASSSSNVYETIFCDPEKLEEFVSDLLGPEKFWKEVIDTFEAVLKDIEREPQSVPIEWLRKPVGKQKQNEASRYTSFFQQIIFPLLQSGANPRVLIVFDEGANLIQQYPNPTSMETDNFLSIRRALSLFMLYNKESFKVMGVFVDTSSRLSNFQPSVGADRSDRVNLGNKLLPPFLWLPSTLPPEKCKYGDARDTRYFQIDYTFASTNADPVTDTSLALLLAQVQMNQFEVPPMDLGKLKDTFPSVGNISASTDETQKTTSVLVRYNPYRIPLLSRPMFAVQAMKSPKDPAVIGELRSWFNYAIEKLLPDPVLPDSFRIDNDASWIPWYVLGACRFSTKSTSLPLNEKLVASHMATCLGYTETRTKLIARYVSEPMLSEAAMQVIHYTQEKHMIGKATTFVSSDLIMEKILKTFAHCINAGLIENMEGKGRLVN